MLSSQRSIQSGDHTFPFTLEVHFATFFSPLTFFYTQYGNLSATVLQIPNVNYPPSFEPIGFILLGHCRYYLRAYIDTLGMPSWHASKPVNIKFRPVVVAPVNCSFAYHNRLQQQPKKATEPVEVDVQLTMPKEVWFAG